MSRKVELFLAAKRVLRSHPDFTDQEIADHIGARLIEAEEIIREARKDSAADHMEPTPAEKLQAEERKRVIQPGGGPV